MTDHVLLAHELAHVRQHGVLGPLYLPAHVLAQLWSAARTDRGDTAAYAPSEQAVLVEFLTKACEVLEEETSRLRTETRRAPRDLRQ